MSDLDGLLKKWREGTEPIAPRGELVDRIREEVRTTAASPVLAPRPFAPLMPAPPRRWPVFVVGWLSGLLMASGFFLLRPREPVVVIAEKQVAPQVDTEDAPAKSSSATAELAYPFVASTMDGERVSLADLRGKLVVIDFWETGCGPCWSEFDALARVRREHPDIVFLAIATDSAEALKLSERRGKHPFPVIADPDEKISGNYPVHGYPTHVVVDRQGRILEAATFSGSGKSYEKLEAAIAVAAKAPADLPVREVQWIEGNCEVHGRVMSSKGQPVPHAWVSLTVADGEANRLTTTDAEGRFTFDGLSCVDYSLFGGKDGFTDAPWVDASPRAGKSAEVTLVLPGKGAIDGVVTDLVGKPVAGAIIESCVDWSTQQPLRSQTDRAGHFRLAGLDVKPDTELIVVMPGANVGASVEVEVDETRQLSHELKVGLGRLKVKVTGPMPGKAVDLSIFPADGTACRARAGKVTVQQGGSVTLVLPLSSYALSIVGHEDKASNATVEVTPGRNEDVTLRIVPGTKM